MMTHALMPTQEHIPTMHKMIHASTETYSLEPLSDYTTEVCNTWPGNTWTLQCWTYDYLMVTPTM